VEAAKVAKERRVQKEDAEKTNKREKRGSTGRG
jgi:hypothetical protein